MAELGLVGATVAGDGSVRGRGPFATSHPDRLIGRDSERAALDGFLDDVAAGPSALFIEGAAGIGKSTLWTCAIEAARMRSFRILSCRATLAEAPLSFAALGDLLGGVLDEALPSIPAPQRRALDVALLRAEADGAAPDRRAVSLAAHSLLRVLAESGPVLIALDDVQWLDRPSAGVLGFALRRLDAERIGSIATQRTEGGTRFELDGTGYAVRRMAVGPLSSTETDALLRERTGTALPRPVLHRVHEAAGGNPLYMLEIAEAIKRRGVTWSSGMAIPVPEDLQKLILERVERLSGPVRKALLVASALAQPTTRAVTDATGGGEGATNALARASRAGFIQIEDARIRFAHPLIGSVVYASAPSETRRPLHRRLAEIVADPEERARHLALATDDPDAAVAAVLDDAARGASARGAPDAAADLMEKALALTPPGDPDDATRRRLQAAEHHFAAGDTARARRNLEEAVEGAAAGRLRGQALLRLGVLRSYDDDVREAVSLLDGALVEAADDLALMAEIHHAQSTILSTLRDTGGVVFHARKALELAEEVGDPALLAKALTTVGYADFVLGNGIDTELMQRALTLEPAVAGAPIDELPSASFGLMLMWSDDLEGARRLLESVHRLAVARGDAASLATVMHYLSELECRAGNFELASRYATEGDEAATQTGQDARRVYSLLTRALADAHLGRADEARAEAEEALSLAERTHHSPAVRLPSIMGFLELSLGRAAEAHRWLEPLPDRVVEAGIVELGFHRFLPDEIEALISLGDLERVSTLLPEFEARARAQDRTWALAAGARCRSLLLSMRGDLIGATAAIDEALVHHARLGQPFELGRTLVVAGVIHRRAKQKRASREALQGALEIFDRLGARLWSERAREELGRIGGRAARPWELTATESKVAELAAAGRTNKEVAEALFLSTRTVEGTLSRAYHKLGVRSRTELARKLAEPTPGDPFHTLEG